MPLDGCATATGTRHYRDRFPNAALNYFREKQLVFSSVGIGTYLGDADERTDNSYSEAVVSAVERGANVIDTAANYRFQRSERSIGAALKVLAQRGFAREEIIICSKGGYLPFDGGPPRDTRAYIEETFIKPGIATWGDIAGGSHCMTPRYLENQLGQSLRNLDVTCLDVYYVHNPESQLAAVSQGEFMTRLRAAFEFLESAAGDGAVKYYGVATWNGFRAEPDSRDYHSLEAFVELAREIGGDNHHFRFVQLPLNLGMPEALFFQNQKLGDEYLSVLEAADGLGINVIASGSILQGQVALGLPESIRETLGSLATDAQTGIQFVRSSPGVTTALVGMSKVAHVEENLQLIHAQIAKPEDLISVFDQEE